MKKNKTLRIALVLCVLAIFCACLVGSTFAKYVTSDNNADTARVSKWGVVVSAATHNTDSNFETEYAIEDARYGGAGTLAVKSSTTDKMVAPGTKDAQGITFTVSGTPEVATKVDIAMTINSDVYLGTAGDYGVAGANGNYYPVVFTLTQTSAAYTDENGDPVVANVVKGNLATIKTAIETYANSAYYAPNTDLGATFTLTWEWAYGEYGTYVDNNSGVAANDVNDTILGDLMAGGSENVPAQYTNLTEGIATGDNWSTNIDYTIVFTITQVS